METNAQFYNSNIPSTSSNTVDTSTTSNENFNDETLVVQDASEFHEESKHIYAMKRKPRGFCMIIHNYNLPNEDVFPYRHGSEIDCKSLRFVFEQLGFIVIVHENLNSKEIKLNCSLLAENKELHNHDVLAVILLSHGDNGVIYGVDGEPVLIDELLEYFNADECRYLKLKPKMFFVSACRGGKLLDIIFICIHFFLLMQITKNHFSYR